MKQTLSGKGYEIVKDNPLGVLSALASQNIAMWEYDIPTGECKLPDDYFKILGMENAGIYFDDMDGFYRFVLPEDRESYRINFTNTLKELIPDTRISARCIGTNYELIYLENHFLSCQKDENGNPDKLLAYTINVTGQYKKETELRSLANRNRKIIDALAEFIFIFDDNFFIRDVLMSPKMVLLHPVDVLHGADARTIYSPEVSELFICTIHECLNDGQLKAIEYHLDMDGTRFYFQARITPFEENTVLALIYDIGERVRHSEELIEAKQKAENADHMKSVFLANMSHEIRTPLNAIVGFSEIIAETRDDDEKKKYIGVIKHNSNLLLQLINDILDLSRIESGKSEISLEPIEISSLIDEVEKVHHLKMQPGVELKVIRPDGELRVVTDRNRVTQVLFNFLSNAIKNTEKGSITLELRVENDWLKISVSDTGCGIAKEKLPLIFGRFEKLNEFAQGTGLGLSICKSIVERLGGHIGVESDLGRGSTFSLYLPYIHSNNFSGVNSKLRKILIAEDAESSFAQINAVLKNDYTISWVRNGQEAVESFLRESPDLILMDIRMPVMNGVEATEKIRAISMNVPIIAVTAHVFYPEQQQALRAGCNEILTKPYSMERLKEVINTYL